MLGYLVHSFHSLQPDMIRHLRLDDGEAFIRAQQSGGASSQAGPSRLPLGEIYPHLSKEQARNIWRSSNVAKGIAPSLGLALGSANASGVDDDELAALSEITHHRYRVEEARKARSYLLGHQQQHLLDMSAVKHAHEAADMSAVAAAAFVQGHHPPNHTPLAHYPIPVHASTHDHTLIGGGGGHHIHPNHLPFSMPPPSLPASAHFVPTHPSLAVPLSSAHSAHYGKSATPSSSANEQALPTSTPPADATSFDHSHAPWSHQPFDLADLGEDAHALAYALGLPAAEVQPDHGNSGGQTSHQHHRHVPASFLLNTTSSPGAFYNAPAFSSPSPVAHERGGRTSSDSLAYAHATANAQARPNKGLDTPKPFDDDLDALANLAGVHVGHGGQASSILFQLGLQDQMDGLQADVEMDKVHQSSPHHDPLPSRSNWPSRMTVQ
jgi:hypothetical protein